MKKAQKVGDAKKGNFTKNCSGPKIQFSTENKERAKSRKKSEEGKS